MPKKKRTWDTLSVDEKLLVINVLEANNFCMVPTQEIIDECVDIKKGK